MISKNDLDRGNVPQHIITVLETIGNNGFHCVIVGGAVRDMLMGLVPIEYDLASNALPEDIEQIFEHTTPMGKQFGTILVHIMGHSIEITTYRKESGYSDSRHPDHVEFSSHITDDLNRRDFTMNAMAYNPVTNEFFDSFDGMNHLNDRRLVCVGEPKVRFREDSLRPFRCFRFMAQMGCIVDRDIRAALDACSDIPLPAMERIRQEMDRLLMGSYWLSALNVMDQTGWLKRILNHESDIPRDVELPQELLYRWAWLTSFSGNSDCAQALLFSKKDVDRMTHISRWNYDSYAIDLTVNDLAVSSSQLMALGFTGKALGDLQQKLLDLVRRRELENVESDQILFAKQFDDLI